VGPFRNGRKREVMGGCSEFWKRIRSKKITKEYLESKN